MSKYSVSYGRLADPSLRCCECHATWYLPQSIRWNDAELDKQVSAAREKGWKVSEWGSNECQDHKSL